MKNTLNLCLVIASSLFLSACGIKDNNSSNSSSPQSDSKSSFSLRQLIAQNIPQKCTYSGQNEEGSFTTEMVISGKKFNQIITMKLESGEEKINSISDGEYLYTWGTRADKTSFATKLKADFNTEVETSEIKNNESSLGDNISSAQADLDTKFEGDCEAISVNDSDFQPPTNIKFEDYSQFLDDIKSNMPEIDLNNLE